MSDKELEEQLSEAGARLSEPPSTVEDLLTLLDETENCLSKVEQSPATSIQHALSPSLKALVANKLLKHSDVDVKVAVAACVSEITRITAPEAPYNDEEMKEIFQLIVASFEKLYDTSSRLYGKRISILETVAKVRSCVVMLDLECDGLILEMFNHFLKAIRDFHSENIFSSMETIMSLVLEESEEISVELLSPLLTSVKKENQDVLPIAQKLAEKVLQNCTTKLTPCLKQVLKSIGTSPNEYSRIVATICQENTEAVENNDDILSGEHMAIDRKPPENTSSDKPHQEDEEMEPAASCPGEVEPSGAQEDEEMELATKNVLSNGDTQLENVDSSLGVESPLENEESNRPAAQALPSDAEPDSLDSNVAQTETKADQTTKKKRGRKPSSAVQNAEASGRSPIDSDKGNSDLPDQRKSPGKEADNTLAEDETLPQVSSPSASRDEPVKVASPPPSQSVPDGARTKRGRTARTKKGPVNEDAVLESNLAQNESGGPSTDAISKKEHEGSSEIEGKPQRRSSKKTQTGKGGEEDVAPTKGSGVTSDSDSKPVKRSGKKVTVKDKNEHEEDAAPTKDAVATDSDSKPVKRLGKKVTVKDKNETEEDAAPTKNASASSDSDAKPLKQSGKKLNVKDKGGNEGESSEKKQGGKGKKGKGTPIAKSDSPGEPSNKKIGSSSKSTAKATPKGQKHMEETPKTTSKRKRTAEKDEPSETQESEEFGENLVGSKIKVWWPDDAMFYEGVVDSFDPIKKKHKVLYVDGDEEILLLKDERWVFVDTTKSEEQADLPSPDASDSHRKKKAKKTPGSSSKQTKTDTTLKRVKGASTSKSKNEGTKSGAKAKDDGEADGKTTKTGSKSKNESVGKSKTDTPKTGSKTKVDQQKTVSDSKDTPKSGSKSKDETPKTANKTKGDALKSGSKSKTGAKSKDDMPKAISKTKEDETPKTAAKDDTPKANNKPKSATSKAGSKSKANGSATKAKTVTSKAEESEETPKGKSSGAATKAQESEPRSGSKRRRK